MEAADAGELAPVAAEEVVAIAPTVVTAAVPLAVVAVVVPVAEDSVLSETEIVVATGADSGLLRLSARRSGLLGGRSEAPPGGDGERPELLARSRVGADDLRTNDAAAKRSRSRVRRSSL